MYRNNVNNVHLLLVTALSVASIILTHTLFAFVKNVQFESAVMKQEYSQFLLITPSTLPLTRV